MSTKFMDGVNAASEHAKAGMSKEDADKFDTALGSSTLAAATASALGASDSKAANILTQGMVAAYSGMETDAVEAEHPAPANDPFAEYTPVERALAELMVESTGANILDSGGHYNRSWQRHRDFVNSNGDFRTLPEVNCRGFWLDDADPAKWTFDSLSVSMFHFLKDRLELDEKCAELQRRMDAFGEKHGEYGLSKMEAFFQGELESEGWTAEKSFNSYNHETTLDETIQGVVLIEDDTEDAYLLLQVHGGCDVRGGYTEPRVFRIGDDEALAHLSDWASLTAGCDCGAEEERYADSDDAGNTWYRGGFSKEGLPGAWKLKPDEGQEIKNYVTGDLVCEKCGAIVWFNAPCVG